MHSQRLIKEFVYLGKLFRLADVLISAFDTKFHFLFQIIEPLIVGLIAFEVQNHSKVSDSRDDLLPGTP